MAVRIKRSDTEAELDGRRIRGDKTRALVLKRALEIASVNGLEGLTIGELAKDVGISKGNIGILFGTKESLQLAILDESVQVFVRRIVERIREINSPLKQLVALCDGWFEYVDRRVFPGGCFLYATSSEFRAKPGHIQDRVKLHRRAWSELLTSTAKNAQQTGEIREGTDVDQLVFECVAYQAAANTASLLGDKPMFRRARRSTRAVIDAASRRYR